MSFFWKSKSDKRIEYLEDKLLHAEVAICALSQGARITFRDSSLGVYKISKELPVAEVVQMLLDYLGMEITQTIGTIKTELTAKVVIGGLAGNGSAAKKKPAAK